ncbi:MAG: hypothetical protein U0794_03865 [Isosphaeraceae bacterium]
MATGSTGRTGQAGSTMGSPGMRTERHGEAQEHSEGMVARAIEQQTAKLPSDLFLWAAGASILGSLTLKMMDKDEDALFVGQWAAPFLLLGLYNKVVKVAGSDRVSG